MCRYCDFRYDTEDTNQEREIFKDTLTNDWYLNVKTSEWDDVGHDWIYQRLYGIQYCPYCGRKL